MGRYILEPSIFTVLANLERGAGGEYQLTDALHEVCRHEGLLALDLIGKRYDIGDKFGYIKYAGGRFDAGGFTPIIGSVFAGAGC